MLHEITLPVGHSHLHRSFGFRSIGSLNEVRGRPTGITCFQAGAFIPLAAIRSAIRLHWFWRKRAYVVHTASNGQQALAWLRSNPRKAKLILLDLMMPVMDGRSFLTAKEADPTLSRVPVVVITASGTCSQVQKAHHVQGCLPKPIPIDRLLHVAAAH